MKTQLVCDTEKCCACYACVIACMDQNDTDVFSGELPRRTVTVTESAATGEVIYRSNGCLHCADAPCVNACPTGCLYKDEGTGLTLYDAEKCVGCRACFRACPHGAVVFGKDGRINKCDGCIERRRAGLEPACVRICPAGALSFGRSGD